MIFVLTVITRVIDPLYIWEVVSCKVLNVKMLCIIEELLVEVHLRKSTWSLFGGYNPDKEINIIDEIGKRMDYLIGYNYNNK